MKAGKLVEVYIVDSEAAAFGNDWHDPNFKTYIIGKPFK
jgi:hypothetical protein